MRSKAERRNVMNMRGEENMRRMQEHERVGVHE